MGLARGGDVHERDGGGVGGGAGVDTFAPVDAPIREDLHALDSAESGRGRTERGDVSFELLKVN